MLSTSDAAANTDGSLYVANSLAHHLDFSLCASSANLPDRIFAPVLIASSPVSSKCLIGTSRLSTILSSLLVEGFCNALTLLTRRHAVVIRFGSLLPLLNSSGPSGGFPGEYLSSCLFLIEWSSDVCHHVALPFALSLCSSVLFFGQLIGVGFTCQSDEAQVTPSEVWPETKLDLEHDF